ncbi:piggyBac transposable element-derived protein 4-like [Octopus sinensis]|uniref:PiggyBac transposable element-derived protein 4-like n=1 Tax=Octopus sinensis TaxID=2607531 RepID=A0A6P7SFE6_9MOLL|nr:piggyBac transposable element-derived protein 4-like [Octopus sinensis]
MDEMFQYIADETYDYAENHPQHVRPGHGSDWFPTTGDEIKVLLGLLILMGIMKKPILASYCNQDPAMSTPFFLKTMPHDRFVTLLRNLYFNSGANQDDRLHKISPIIDEAAENFSAHFGAKVYKVFQSTGRARKIYVGQDRLDLPLSTLASTDVVLSLNENLFNIGYNIYMDNWFFQSRLLPEAANED